MHRSLALSVYNSVFEKHDHHLFHSTQAATIMNGARNIKSVSLDREAITKVSNDINGLP